METLSLNEIKYECNGYVNKNIEFTGVCIDTRKIEKGNLFVCIKGERFDAHNFIQQAYDNGAAAVMIHTDDEPNGPYIRVEDTSKGLLDLARYYRSKFSIPVIGLTGSVGKTTTKEFTSLVVESKYRTIKTQGNLNNEIGLPQTIFQIDNDTEAAVIEMGMNHFGEISRLVNASKPDIAIITNIGVSHIENLGSREGILKAKLEILEGLKPGGTLIINNDNDLLSTVNDNRFNILRFGIDSGEIRASNIVEGDSKTKFVITYKNNKFDFEIPTIGIHNVYNALAAFCVGISLDIDFESIASSLSKYIPAGMRQKIVRKDNKVFIEDCYNASPDSMKASISTLSAISIGRKIAVLGDMLELGDYSKTAHRMVGSYLIDNKIDLLLCVGNEILETVNVVNTEGIKTFHYKSNEDLSKALKSIMKDNDTILFKASHGMHLENVISEVVGE